MDRAAGPVTALVGAVGAIAATWKGEWLHDENGAWDPNLPTLLSIFFTTGRGRVRALLALAVLFAVPAGLHGVSAAVG
jgi:hypothetical protein